MRKVLVAAALMCVAAPVLAQDAQLPQTDADWMVWVPDAAALEMPDLAFEERERDIEDYDKYYYFQREDADFETALADLRECDAHARGLHRSDFADSSSVAAYNRIYGGISPVSGALGSAVGNPLLGAFANAVYGSGELRLKRRVNMRRCMFFKDYGRFGLSEGVWDDFNFEEGNREVSEADRQHMLVLQALVASGPRPQASELGL